MKTMHPIYAATFAAYFVKQFDDVERRTGSPGEGINHLDRFAEEAATVASLAVESYEKLDEQARYNAIMEF